VTDVLIVGSGPVGAAYARLITEADPRLQVTMLDAGPLLAEPPGVNVRNLPDEAAQAAARRRAQGPTSAPEAGSAVPVQVHGTITARDGTYLVDPGNPGMPAAAASACVGGMGTLWTCAVPEPQDSERIGFIDAGEWRAATRVAGRLLSRTTSAFADSPHVRVIRERVAALFDDRLPAGRKVGILPVAGDPQPDGTLRWAGVDTVLGAARVDLQPDTLALELLAGDGSVSGARVRHLPTGDEEEIHARAVVVAADAWHTPQLLWASGIRPAPLGHHLTEHPLTFAIVVLGEDVDRAAGGVRPAAGVDPVSGVVNVPFADPGHPFHAQIMHVETPMFPVDLTGVEVTNAGFASMGWGVRKRPRFEDCVTFSDADVDAWGMPRLSIRYELTSTEEAELAQALTELKRAASALGTYVPGCEPRKMPAGTSIHYMGSVRMGDDGGEASVCDSHSRVWGFRNLFVGGNGVIPTANACNPTLTSVALAARAVPRLLEVLSP
jgi:choline dehydrogenase-like flavoprotein